MSKSRSRRVRIVAVIVPTLVALLAMSGCSRDPNVRKRKYLESGKRYEKDGKLKEAAIQFTNALKVDKNYADAHYEMARTYLQMGAIRPGYDELMRAVELAPGNLQARVDLGNLLLAGNATDRAAEQGQAVVAADPNNADGYALLAKVAARKADHAGALSNIQHALSIAPNRADFHTTLALIQSSDPQTVGATEQELQKAISLDAKDTHPRIIYAAILEHKGDKAGAEAQLQAAIQATPTDLQPRGALAGLYMRSGDKVKAEQTFRKAVDELPDNEQASEVLKDYYLQTGQTEMGEAAFADLSGKHPKSFPIKLNYATLLGARAEYSKLQPVVDQLAKTNGSHPQVQLLKSSLLLSSGKVNDAVDLLQNGVKNAPDNVQLQLALAKVALLKGDMNLAASSFQTAEKLAPQNLDVQVGMAEIATRRNDPNQLIATAEKSLQIRPDYIPAYLWRGSGEALLKQLDKAATDFQTVIDKSPENPSAYIELGQVRLQQGKLPEGSVLFEKALEKDPNSATALDRLVSIALYQKQSDKAIARIQQQIGKSTKNADMYTMLAGIQMRNKDLNGARDNAKKAMGMNPADARAVEIYSSVMIAQGNMDEAIRAWQAWNTANPKNAMGISLQALAEEQKGDKTKAMDDYKQALAINPDQGLAANNLAYLMVESGQNVDVALSYAQTARRVLGNNPSTADTLAWVYYYKGTYLSARDLLEDASKEEPNNAAIHYHLGMTYSKLGRKADAVTQLKKAVSLEPSSQTAKDATTALGQLG